jgi:2-polyprenyl-3-methyl-5-hydroxy-6-metoxy-1,4-benzoquinol methylase
MYSSVLKKNISQEDIDIVDYITRQVNNKQIPSSYPQTMVNSFNKYELRGKFIKQIGFSLLALDWIIPLSKWIGERKCLEVMAGTGSLSYALKEQGVNIIATDNFSWDGQNNWNETNNYWTEIENIDAVEATRKYGKDVDIIIMSWAYMDDTAYRILQAMREVNPDCIMIFIGESCGGCTASDEFFESIIEVEDQEFIEAVKNYKRWFGIYDYPQLVK